MYKAKVMLSGALSILVLMLAAAFPVRAAEEKAAAGTPQTHVVLVGINDYADRLQDTVSQKLQLQEGLLAAQKLEDWSLMSATVSHEIKGPLQAIENLQFLIQSSDGVSQ